MWATILSWLSSIWAKVVVAGAAIAGVFAVYESIKGTGVQKQQNTDLTKELKDVQKTTKIDSTVDDMSDTAVDKQLRSEFSRSE